MIRSSVLGLLLTTACLPQVGPAVDSGRGGGTGGGGGAVPPSCTSASLDGDESDTDCGGSCAPCALLARCGTAVDCASGVCTMARCASPESPCGSFAGCSGFTDLTAGPATIRFPINGDRYSPPCIRVRFGQTVTFEGGDFGVHLLTQACGPVSGAISASSGSSLAVPFNRALGVFGYYCSRHGSATGSGMAGAIEVVR